MSESTFDFSVRNIPDSWNEAAQDAPEATSESSERLRHGRRIPMGTRPDLMTGTLSGIAMSVITGAAWYLNEVNAAFTGPAAVFVASAALGALIAIAVRLGAGPAGPEMRVGVGAALYLSAILAIAFAVSRERFFALNRRQPSSGEVEDLVASDYFNSIPTIAAWALGLTVMAWVTFSLRYRRR